MKFIYDDTTQLHKYVLARSDQSRTKWMDVLNDSQRLIGGIFVGRFKRLSRNIRSGDAKRKYTER